MKVILLEDVKSLGKKGDLVEVSDGYGRNFIIPRKKGVEATNENMNNLKLQKANEEKVARETKEAAQDLAAKLKETSVTIKAKTGAGGKLFGAVSSKEIAEAVKAQWGIEVDKKKILLNEPIKTVGEETVEIRLHREVTAKITVAVEEA